MQHIKYKDSHWGPNPQGGDLGDPIRIIYKKSIVNMGTCDNTHTMKRNTVQLYLDLLELILKGKLVDLPKFGIPSQQFKDLMNIFTPYMF